MKRLSELISRYDEAHLLLSTQQYDAAIELIDKTEEQVRNIPNEFKHLKAYAQKKNGHTDSAILTLEEVIKSGPVGNQAATTYFMMGDIKREEGDIQGTIEAFESFINANPQNPFAYWVLSLVYLEMQDFENALQVAKPAIDAGIKDPNLYALYGTSNYNLGNHSEAESGLLKAADLGIEDAGVQFMLGEIYLERNEVLKSKDFFKKVTDLNPDFSLAHARLGVCYSFMSLYDQAKEEFSRAINLDADNWNAYTGLGILYLKLEEYGNAVNALQSAKDIEDLPINSYYLAFSLLLSERYEEAGSIIDEAVFKGSNLAYAMLGDYYRLKDDVSKAELAYKTQLEEFARRPKDNLLLCEAERAEEGLKRLGIEPE